jgi:hypothetical protein
MNKKQKESEEFRVEIPYPTLTEKVFNRIGTGDKNVWNT